MHDESGLGKCTATLIEPKRKPIHLPFLSLDTPREMANVINKHFVELRTNYSAQA